MDTPAGSVVIGGDASNDVLAPHEFTRRPIRWRGWRRGVDIGASLLSPEHDTRSWLYGKAGWAKYLVLTHLGPSLEAVRHNQWEVPGGPLTEADYRKADEPGGFAGTTIVGTELATQRIPAK
jgi:ribonuclease Z